MERAQDRGLHVTHLVDETLFKLVEILLGGWTVVLVGHSSVFAVATEREAVVADLPAIFARGGGATARPKLPITDIMLLFQSTPSVSTSSQPCENNR